MKPHGCFYRLPVRELDKTSAVPVLFALLWLTSILCCKIVKGNNKFAQEGWFSRGFAV